MSLLAPMEPSTRPRSRTAVSPETGSVLRAPILSVVPGERDARRMVLWTTMVFVVALGLTLLGHIHLAQRAYDLKMLENDAMRTRELVQVRTEEVSKIASPDHLCAAAREQGMVPMSSVRFLRLSDGVVTGAADKPAMKNPAGVCSSGQTNKE